ncbi:MAG: EF-hand domain-containing protein, partial [Rubrimonas sp.]
MKTVTLTAAALAMLTGAAVAQTPDRGPDVEAMFERMDQDGDGAISREEFEAAAPMARIRAMAEQTPLDRDAFAAEMAADAAARAARMFERLDRDGDGLLSAEELAPRRPERRAAMFDRIDADGDGVVTREEAEAAQARWRARAEGRPGRGSDGGSRGDRV